MAKIVCPNCGETIEVDPSSVEDLTRQLRDDLFARDLETRLAEAGHLHEAQVAAVRAEEQRQADRRVAEAEAQLAQLQARLEAVSGEADRAAEKARAASAQQVSDLRHQLDELARAHELALVRAQTQAAEERSALEHEEAQRREALQDQARRAQDEARAREAGLAEEVARLKAQLATQEETLRAEGEAQLLRATADLERSRNELQSQLQVERANGEQAQARLREEMARREGELAQQAEERLEAKDAQIEQYREQLERLRDYRMRLSTKLVGESLERHCESEFNRIRMQAYPRASFEKDNDASQGTKGDFIFRDYDEEGNEMLSIMFEMKNEEEQSSSANRKRNEDHFKKLDSDRTKKGCEYAVLVSTLEPESDFYNAGIADVSWRYPKMFVVRPQCFLTIIGLLKAAALAAHPYRLQLQQARQEELDVSQFEDKVFKIVDGIRNDYTRAAKNYERAEADIDAIIKKLEDLKKQLKTATTWFEAAQNKGERLTVKRLTRGNQTMKAAFARAEKERADGAREAQDGTAEPAGAADVALDPDEME